MGLNACAPVPASYPPQVRQGQISPSPAPVLAPAVDPPVNLLPSKPVPPITAKAALVMDGVTGRILAAKNPDERRAVASTQKLLTALVTLESGPLSDPVTVELSDTQVEPSKVYIRPNETYTRAALVKALMVKSGNDVAKALARDVAGSEAAFVSRMNTKAVSLGMRNSFFMNPHGLTEEGQYSSARDIGILAREAYQSSVLRDFVRTKSYTFTRPSGDSKTLTNTNQLLSKVSYCTGMKTGTTNASGRCLVSSGELDGRLTIVVVLGASNESTLYKESEALLRWSLER
ncbi:D-alanyl-D-alanine carboxypeptidase [Roseibacillus persicicus]|uniref:D-alanyl-D-alanine carboxypeptidase family protein n=1 Tax=Roseibacillus persicicus TaxID=454148 RepID=UPI00280D4DC9|nr:D-alanyl-D-alanine carboxypeptidase [Roseibacillus persicicus]